MIDDLHKSNLDPRFELNYLALHGNVGIKWSIVDENCSMLWHKRFGYISIERIKRLINDEVLKTLDFINFCTCTGSIKGKQTKSSKDAKKSSKILENHT